MPLPAAVSRAAPTSASRLSAAPIPWICFLAGRTAVVESVHQDVENKSYVAVTVDDDPAAALGVRTGRFFYFYPDELELLR